MLRTTSAYLSGWESRYGLSYRKPGKETMTKISGPRYVLLSADETPFDRSLEFRGGGATVKMALDGAAILRSHLAGKISCGFNPIV